MRRSAIVYTSLHLHTALGRLGARQMSRLRFRVGHSGQRPSTASALPVPVLIHIDLCIDLNNNSSVPESCSTTCLGRLGYGTRVIHAYWW